MAEVLCIASVLQSTGYRDKDSLFEAGTDICSWVPTIVSVLRSSTPLRKDCRHFCGSSRRSLEHTLAETTDVIPRLRSGNSSNGVSWIWALIRQVRGSRRKWIWALNNPGFTSLDQCQEVLPPSFAQSSALPLPKNFPLTA